jgi:hypothetical protein
MGVKIEHGDASDLKVNSVRDEHIEESTTRNRDRGQRRV